jgi:hypothetical protein
LILSYTGNRQFMKPIFPNTNCNSFDPENFQIPGTSGYFF